LCIVALLQTEHKISEVKSVSHSLLERKFNDREQFLLTDSKMSRCLTAFSLGMAENPVFEILYFVENTR